MAVYNTPVLTTKGKEMITNSVAKSKPFWIKLIGVSSRDYSREDITNLNTIETQIVQGFSNSEVLSSGVILSSIFENSQYSQSITFQTIGIWASSTESENDRENMTLLAIITSISPDTLPDKSKGAQQLVIDIELSILDTSQARVQIEPSSLVKKKDINEIEKAIEKLRNDSAEALKSLKKAGADGSYGITNIDDIDSFMSQRGYVKSQAIEKINSKNREQDESLAANSKNWDALNRKVDDLLKKWQAM